VLTAAKGFSFKQEYYAPSPCTRRADLSAETSSDPHAFLDIVKRKNTLQGKGNNIEKFKIETLKITIIKKGGRLVP